jgi:hypothetical protein
MARRQGEEIAPGLDPRLPADRAAKESIGYLYCFFSGRRGYFGGASPVARGSAAALEPSMIRTI